MTHSCWILKISAAFVLSASVQGAVILNENFDELTPQLDATSAGAFSAIDGTNVNIVGPGLFPGLCAAPESGTCVDLEGSGGAGGPSSGVLQTNNAILLLPGVDYYLSFDLIGPPGGPDPSTTVNFGPYSQTFALGIGDTTDGIVNNALVTVSTQTLANLTFTNNSSNTGDVLDKVLITSAPVAAVPEPSNAILIGLALLSIHLLRRRRATVSDSQ
jgi:hypothetical protein